MRRATRARSAEKTAAPADCQRLDKWLWFARFARTRPLAVKFVDDGHVRLNGAHALNAARMLRRGDILTLALPRNALVIEVLDFAARRGPAAEAVRLYRAHQASSTAQAS